MKQLRYFFAIIASALLMVACQEDFGGDYINDGTLKLRFEIPAPEAVDITRGAVEETEAYDVVVYIFEKVSENGVEDGELYSYASDEDAFPIRLELTPTGEESYTRKYEVDLSKYPQYFNAITLRPGFYDIYAIANTTSNSLWDGIAAFNGVTKKSEFEALALTLNTIENTSKRMTLSGHTTLTVGEGNANQLSADIKLSRPYSKVTFNVKNGTVNPNFKFTPTSYSIYNIPSKSRMFDNTALVTNNTFKNYENRAIPLSGSFEFIQLENIYDIANGPTKYTDREKRVEGSREFAYAPKYSTYVVIYGDGVETETETDAEGNVISTKTTKISKTNYTIHLGDFSTSGSMGNYSVERNTHYTYNVTVNGVNMIEVEAKSDKYDASNFEHGAEGYVIDMSQASQVYNLDAHYETVMLRFNKDMIIDPKLITLSVSTPLMTEKDKNFTLNWTNHIAPMYNEATGEFDQAQLAKFYKRYDAQWVEFLPVASNSFAAYPGTDSKELLDICELMKELVNVGNSDPTSLKLANDGYYYVVAFIDEFYYGDKDKNQDGTIDTDDRVQGTNGVVDLTKFINKPEGREMKIMQNPQVSADGYSIYSQALCAFSQKSISTMFKLNSTANIFGIEMYDETGLLSSATTNQLAGDDKTNGRANMTGYIKVGTDEWTTIVNNSGYSYLGQPEGNSLNALRQKDAGYACMQRNRDLNGNGKIDNNEVRWYVPALDQYSAFWYGEEALPTYARLFQGLTTDVKSHEEHSQLSHYFTSTEDYRIFFAIEGSSYHAYPYNNADNNTRCIRNLRSVTGDPAKATSIDGNYLYVNNFVETAYRDYTQNGQYPEHHEREIANKLPHAFKVAALDITNFSDVTAEYTVKAPNITSAVSRDGKTTLTFADIVTDGTVAYYYTTSNTAAQTNRLEISNHQATIPGIILTDDGGFDTKTITISSATYQNSALSLTLKENLPSGVTLHYATSLDAVRKTPATGNNRQYSCGNNPNVYVWASADGGTTLSETYATITTTTNTNTETVTIKEVSCQAGNTQGSYYHRIILDKALPSNVTLYYATSLNGIKTRVDGTTQANGTVQFNLDSGSTNLTTTYVWLYNGTTYSSPATITTEYETTTNGVKKTVTISRAERRNTGQGSGYYYRITLSANLPSGVTIYYRQGVNGDPIEVTPNNQRQCTLGSRSQNYDPTYVWISGDGGETYSDPITITGNGSLSGTELRVDVTTTEPKSTTSDVDNLSIDVTTTTTTVANQTLNVNIPIPPTGVLYLWAFDQGLRTFSNSTVVDAANIQIGGDKTITKTGAANWDEMRILATTKDLCANYKDDDDVPDAPEWRVPNQRELTIMNLYPTELKLVGTSKHAYFSCTKYSNAVNASQPEGAGNNRRYSFVIENQKGLTYGGGVIAVDTRATSFHIRCVRDLAPSEDPNNEGSDDNFGQGEN